MRARRRPGQRGVALILLVTVLVLGMAWYTVGLLRAAPVSTAQREIETGLALQEAKRALLGYAAQYAARSGTTEPGQMPCPESLTLANPGQASSACSALAVVAGRLPWRTLGVDQLRDGYGEPLWYMMRGFRSAPINFASAGQLAYNGSAVVAMIIAPGAPLNTAATAGAPPAGCTKQSQLVATRNTAPLSAANFLECGVATGSLVSPGDPTWTNDRVIAITAAEWADAIAPVVADRIQREVAVALRNWDADELAATGRSWGATHGLPYLPFASTWGDPTTTDYCGNQDAYHGLVPLDPTCYDNPWTVNSVTTGGLLNIYGFGTGCTDFGTYLRCRFERNAAGSGSATAQITAGANNVARAFRGTLRPQDLTISDGGTATLSMSLPNATSDATMTVSLTWAGPLATGQVVTVQIPHLQPARVLSDARITWFWNNNWQQYTYYAVAGGAVVNPLSACVNPGDAGCLTVNGLAAGSGNANDKRLVLVLSGRSLGPAQPSATRADYFEGDNDASDVTAPNTVAAYQAGNPGAAFNDRVAACPFAYAGVQVCN